MGTFNTEEEGHEQLDYALAEGVNFIDTAEYYPIPPEIDKQGNTEIYIGNWIEKRGKRDDFYLTSKVQGDGRPLKTRTGPARLNKKQVLEAIDGSLLRLKTDYVDLYQIHIPDRDSNFMGKRGVESINDGEEGAPIEETLEALNEIVKAGKARYIGVSNESAWGVHRYLELAKEHGWPRIVTIQNQYSLLNRTFEIGLSEFALREGVELLAYSPLNKSVLSGKYLGGVIPENSRFGYSMRDYERYNPEHAQPVIEKYKALAEANDMTLVELSLAFVNSRPFLASNIIGATNLEQLKEDIGSIDIELSDDVMEEIKKIYTEHPDPTC